MFDKKETAGLIIERPGGEILVLHRKNFVPEGNCWGLIGGGIENSADILDSLVHKVKQEIGWELNRNEIQKIKVFDWNDPNVRFHLYKTQVKNPSGIKLNLDGHSEYKWAIPKDLYKKDDLMKGLYKIIEEIYL